MRPLLLLLSLILLSSMISCKETPENKTLSTSSAFYIGTYSKNSSKGIYKTSITSEGKFTDLTVAAQIQDPSWLTKTKDGNFLIALSEKESGSLSSYKIHSDSLQLLSTMKNIGMHPCHISVNNENIIVVSNYSSGDISSFTINAQGTLEKWDTLTFTGSGPHERQDAPHAHSTEFLNHNTLLTADLGTDKLWITGIHDADENLALTLQDSIVLSPGSGPRHMVKHPDRPWLYVINELSSTVTVLSGNNNSEAFHIIQEITTLPDDFSGESWCAEIQIDHTGKYLYASNRGHQSVVIYEVDQEDGTLSLLDFEDVRGDWPRNFTITPDNQFLIVANERSDNLVCFKRDRTTGKLTFTDELKVPSPVCLVF